MRWASALSRQRVTTLAIAECCRRLEAELEGQPVDLAVAFASPELGPDFHSLGRLIQKRLGARVLLGCSGGGLIADGQELEQETGLAITAAHLPGVDVIPFHLENGDLPDPDCGPQVWQRCLGVEAPAQFILLVDGSTFVLEPFLAGLDFAFPLSPKLGGLASGRRRVLFINDQSHTSGVSGIALKGNIAMDTLVAQGCRPIGPCYRITGCQEHILTELDQASPLETLRGLLHTYELAAQDLFVGLLANEFNTQPQAGDFLIRTLIGVDPERGALAIGAYLRVGQTLQFHVRDRAASSQDLNLILANYLEQGAASAVKGALVFSCLGRGTGLYGVANHDSDSLRHHLGAIPMGGFFGNGEIGPVGQTTYIHGWTSAIGLFRTLEAASF
ncbi:FIST signal transduction protein [Anthocerotibacter panamensis]|uniref:FIST signal transduction protein n=1 Tax=Anthocerotibacter panamensis TaxID=2857077 RepID=UPI001C405FBF|nr:FIST N-terminal domain-containing protein [Anthocerotibacter panamensis]